MRQSSRLWLHLGLHAFPAPPATATLLSQAGGLPPQATPPLHNEPIHARVKDGDSYSTGLCAADPMQLAAKYQFAGMRSKTREQSHIFNVSDYMLKLRAQLKNDLEAGSSER